MPSIASYLPRGARRIRLALSTLLLAIAAVALGGSPVLAQQRLDGVVRSEQSGQPANGATVEIAGLDADVQRTVTCDGEGRFSLAGLSPGRYALSVTADGFVGRRVTVELSPRAMRNVIVELEPLARIDERVTVRDAPDLIDAGQTATVVTIGRDRIAMLPTERTVSLTASITPFVSSAVSGHDDLVHLRGNELSLGTFINGVSFFDNPHSIFTPGFAPDVIQSMNVVTGGFPAEFGNRFGGIVDLTTRSGFDANGSGSLSIGAGTYLRDSVAAGYGDRVGRFGYYVFGQGFQSDRFLNTPDPERHHDFGRTARAFAQLDFAADDNDTFRLVLSGSGSNFELPNRFDEEQHGRDAFQRTREQSAILTWDHTFSDRTFVTASLYERLASARLVPTTDDETTLAFGFRNDLTTGFKGDLTAIVGSHHTIKAGVDLMLLSLREDFHLHPREEADDHDHEGEEGEHEGEDDDHEGDDDGHHHEEAPEVHFRGRLTGGQVSTYIQDRIQLAHRITANLGVRFDHYHLTTDGWALSPRLNLTFGLPDDKTVLHASYSRFFSPPPIENQLLSANLGVDGQPPQIERSHQFEVGARRALGPYAVARVTGFWRNVENSFETTELADSRTYLPTTFAEGVAYGIETQLDVPEIVRLGISGWVSYTAQRVTQTTPVSGGFSDHDFGPGVEGPPAFDQVHTAVAGISWRERRSGVFAGGWLEYGSGTPAEIVDAQGEERRIRLDSHTVGSLYAGIEAFRTEKRSVTFRFDVENVGNRVYAIGKESELVPIQYSAPRFLSGSIRVRF